MSWVDAEDIAAAGAAVLVDSGSHAGKIYPLAVEALSMENVARMIGTATGTACTYQQLGRGELEERQRSLGPDPYHASRLHDYQQVNAEELTECAEVFDLEPVLGRKPADFSSFLKRHLVELGRDLQEG